MNRRDWLKAAGVTGVSFALPSAMISAQAASGAAQLDTEIKRLKLRHTWTTTMSSSEFRDTLHVCYTKDGVTGYGEGAPIVRYHENAVDAQKAVESIREFLLSVDPGQFRKNTATLFQRIDGQFAAKSAHQREVLYAW
jgi:L-alanine-DL-glutamate epimerase-like enolase superfamily enzyme